MGQGTGAGETHTWISQTAWLPSKLPSRVTSGHTFTAVFSLKSHEVKVLHYIFPDVQVTSGAAPRSRWGASPGTGGVPTLHTGTGPRSN